MEEYPKKRNLDGCYFRVQRGDKFENLCFTDMTEEERMRVCEGKGSEWLKALSLHLARIVRMVGDNLDVEFRFYEGGG